jgi:hypothetical protein
MTIRAFLVAASLALLGCPNSSDLQRLPIGVACSTSGQCGTGKFFCAVMLPNGYCKADCKSDGDCPSGSVCVGAAVMTGACARRCPNGAGDCRAGEGYLCITPVGEASAAYCDAPTASDLGTD